jgi:IS30 family transposase
MKYRTRTYYSDSQKALMWERWKEGDSLQQIAQLFNRSHSSVEGILSRTGGIRPPERHRCAVALTLAEREEISRAMAAGFSIRAIAAILGRAPSSVSHQVDPIPSTCCREIKRAWPLLAVGPSPFRRRISDLEAPTSAKPSA